MKKFAFLAVVAALAGCAGAASNVEESRNKTINVVAVSLGTQSARCLPWASLQLTSQTSWELQGELRLRFLTPQAEAAGVRVFIPGADVTNYGTVSLYYTNSDGTCLLFAETLGLQEYTIKAGMDPTLVTTGYERQPVPAPAPQAAPPAPQVVPPAPVANTAAPVVANSQ